MQAIEVTAETSGVIVEQLTEGQCAACAHPLAAHDAISVRFCTATTAGRHERGCVCPVGK
ncbi:hypothetical protein FHS29_006160 [Saccharothrix tamanrassetensis]|uniref:Uncharacterized protein n=1 Tax=Saccharothrix tamanrassetensis TaxID=1051531 RepID=A0A841CQH2_9PSEU|nr:RGCVC family protein [Saccharothrix tamanrassetensis]MBB5959539.1 hypothetical protein [Saccharothrix tamanrassetensis]